MGSDREKLLQGAEKLLKSGKVSAGLAEIRQAASRCPNDLLFQNRVGDLLALCKLTEEAVTYYQRVACTYRDTGFLPKAVAMFKKILRLHPDSFETMVELGTLYLKQKLPGEARNYLLHAADNYLKSSTFDRALDVYRILAEAEPEDIRHQVRLVETMAAAGDERTAGEKLLELADRMVDGDPEEVEKIYRRSAELLPDRQEPPAGIASTLVLAGKPEAALALLDAEIEERAENTLLIGAKIQVLLHSGKAKEGLDLLAGSGPETCSVDLFQEMLKHFLDTGKESLFWERVEPWFRSGAADPHLVDLLEAAVKVEKPAHLHAMKLLFLHHDGLGREEEAVAVLETLIGFLRSAAEVDEEELDSCLERLMELRPDSPILEAATAAGPAESAESATQDPGDEEDASAEATNGVDSSETEEEDLRSEYPELEAPAVPLNKSDEEFAAGRLTQAEILTKYGLADKALEQVQEVIERFPGHVEALTRMTQLLQGCEDPERLRDACVGLAFAERASGNQEAAERAAARAAQVWELTPETRKALEVFGLWKDKAGQPDVDGPEPEPERSIEESAAQDEPATAGDPVREADIEEEVFFLEDEAEELEETTDDRQDDLAALTAALEGELFLEEDEPLVPEASQEESLDEVFAAFQQQVDEQVASDDFQTHYDLGIAYKEMGLVDEAIGEFTRVAVPGPFLREACIMIALCHRELGRAEEAAVWYRKALEQPSPDEDARSGLVYDLAEVLAEAGETSEALGLFRGIREGDPHFREVDVRVAELESRLGE